MNKKVITFSAISLILLDFALLFKILHWAGGNLLTLITLGFCIPATIIMAAIDLKNTENRD